MKITDVRVRIARGDSPLKATASVAFDDAIVIHDIKVIENENGRFISMPSRKIPNGTFVDVAHPINNEARTELQEAILSKYEEVLAAQTAAADDVEPAD